MIQQAKFTYSLFGKAFENQTKTIEDLGEKQVKMIEEHEKQLAESYALLKSMIMMLKKIVSQFVR